MQVFANNNYLFVADSDRGSLQAALTAKHVMGSIQQKADKALSKTNSKCQTKLSQVRISAAT